MHGVGGRWREMRVVVACINGLRLELVFLVLIAVLSHVCCCLICVSCNPLVYRRSFGFGRIEQLVQNQILESVSHLQISKRRWRTKSQQRLDSPFGSLFSMLFKCSCPLSSWVYLDGSFMENTSTRWDMISSLFVPILQSTASFDGILISRQCLLTWIVVAYLLITAFISSLHKLSHPFIIIAANSVLVIFWLAAMGATAHLRSRFKYDVNIYGCYDDGSSIDSTTCLVGRDGLQKRAAVATKTGLAVMSSIAGLSALVM